MAVYFAKGVALAVTTASSPAAPAGVLTGDALVLTISSNTASVANISDTPATTAGYTLLGSGAGGGMVAKIYGKCPASSSDSGATVAFTGITSGTKGVAQTICYTPNAGGTLSIPAGNIGTDTDTTSTAFSATGASLTSIAGDLLHAYWTALAPTGTYTSTMTSTGVTITQAGATMGTRTDHATAGLSGSNTLTFGQVDSPIAVGAAGAPNLAGTANGASAAGVCGFALIREIGAPLLTMQTRRAY